LAAVYFEGETLFVAGAVDHDRVSGVDHEHSASQSAALSAAGKRRRR
jgi:hypothetical protein